ncbi:class I SAM-dependent methyltransferase [Arvimicrobium flavum]|uniref:class I SAM-dependent methyltransferase n=1 Tax=Arvimicrobium flavum TaxID=3393320 RepID=UPI00237A2E5D|nr:DUF1698 domain-containing protein [Mesorhizobium shangrilense]
MAQRLRELPKEEIQRRIDAIQWYHEFDFGDGLTASPKTPDATSHRATWDFIRGELDAIDFTGKSVLDIGCWDGYWSFYAEKRGASRVLASDDRTQNWSGNAGFEVARDLLDSKVESDVNLSVYDLDRLTETFDVILCLGVYYHLFDPYYAFAQLRHRCHENTIIVFEGDVIHGVSISPIQSLALYGRDGITAPRFVPEPATLRYFLEASYFAIEREAFLALESLTPVPEGSTPPTGVNRILAVCRPFSGLNRCFLYLPPFGLGRYDSRADVDPQLWPQGLSVAAAEEPAVAVVSSATGGPAEPDHQPSLMRRIERRVKRMIG